MVAAPRRASSTRAALSALQERLQEQATSILDELASKGAGVRNPSAYVVKAVGRARRQLEEAAASTAAARPAARRGATAAATAARRCTASRRRRAATARRKKPFDPGPRSTAPAATTTSTTPRRRRSWPFDTDAAVAAEYAHLDQKARGGPEQPHADSSHHDPFEAQGAAPTRNRTRTSCARRRTPPPAL